MRNSALIVVILAVCARLIRGEPNSTNETSLIDLKRELRYASEIANITATKINSTLNKYCTHVSRVLTDDCDEFVTILKAKTSMTLPQVVIKDGLNFKEVETITRALSNITGTINEYLLLMTRHLEKEYKMVCASKLRLEEKCNYPDFCSTQPESNKTVLYCSLYKTHDYLDILKFNLQRMHPGSIPTTTIVGGDIELSRLYSLSDLFERWLTMLVLNMLVKQMVIIRQTLTEISRNL